MKIIFHVGQAKTGSSALQENFMSSRKMLLEKGVLYPSPTPKGLPGNYKNHKLVFADLIEPKKMPRHILKDYETHELPAAYQKVEKLIQEGVKRHSPECLLLSSESRFRALPEATRGVFRERLISYGSDDIDIVAYIRSPASWYLSSLNQHIHHAWRPRKPIALFLSRSVAEFAEEFGKDHVKLRPFTRSALVGGDVVEDFCTTYLGQYNVSAKELTQVPRANETLPAEALDIISRYRRHFMHDQDNKFLPEGKGLLRSVKQAASQLDLPKPKLINNLAEAINYNKTYILWLRDNHDLVLPDYDYSRVESGKLMQLPERELELSEIIAIDRDLQANLIASVAKDAWVRDDPEREKWFASLPAQIMADTGAPRVYQAAAVAPGVAQDIQSKKDQNMSSSPKPARSPQEQEDRDNAVAIGRAIFRVETKGQATDKEARKQAWIEKRKAYTKQGRAILKQLSKDGFDLTKQDT